MIVIITIIANIKTYNYYNMPEQINYLELIELNLRRKGYLDIELARLFILAKDAQAETQAKLNDYELLKLQLEQGSAGEATNVDDSDDANSPVGEVDEPSPAVESNDNNDELDKAEADSAETASASTVETN